MAFRVTAATSIPRGTAGRVAIPRWLFASPIWSQASLEARTCFVQIAARYDGENNGRIEFRIRDAHLSRSRASTAFEELQELASPSTSMQGLTRSPHGACRTCVAM